MGNVSRQTEILRKTQKEMLEIKNSVPDMKNAFDALIGRLAPAEERCEQSAKAIWSLRPKEKVIPNPPPHTHAHAHTHQLSVPLTPGAKRPS